MTPPEAQQVERSRKPAVTSGRQGGFLHHIISHPIGICDTAATTGLLEGWIKAYGVHRYFNSVDKGWAID